MPEREAYVAGHAWLSPNPLTIDVVTTMTDSGSTQMPRDFLSAYHSAMVSTLPEQEVEKFRIRLGARLLQPFIDSLDGTQLPLPELKAKLETYLRDELQMAESATVTEENGKLFVDIKGCHLCFGNDRLRAQGKPGFCPFAPGINRAVSKALGQPGRLEGVDKSPGVTGECTIRYQVGLAGTEPLLAAGRGSVPFL